MKLNLDKSSNVLEKLTTERESEQLTWSICRKPTHSTIQNDSFNPHPKNCIVVCIFCQPQSSLV